MSRAIWFLAVRYLTSCVSLRVMTFRVMDVNVELFTSLEVMGVLFRVRMDLWLWMLALRLITFPEVMGVLFRVRMDLWLWMLALRLITLCEGMGVLFIVRIRYGC